MANGENDDGFVFFAYQVQNLEWKTVQQRPPYFAPVQDGKQFGMRAEQPAHLLEFGKKLRSQPGFSKLYNCT